MNHGTPGDVPLTQENVQKDWGAAIDHLGGRGLARIIQCGGLYADGRFIPAADIVGVAVKFATYRGDGKYHANSKLTSYARLPENDEQYRLWLNQGSWVPPTPPAGEGWWPVLSIQTRSGAPTIQRTGPGKKELIICFYQLQGTRLVGWWIEPEQLDEALTW